jgi:hypothetical protein
MKIKVKRIREEDIPELIKFNRRVYPKRDKIKEPFSYRFLKNPFAQQLYSYISYLEDDSIIGQILLMPSQFKYNGKIQDATWGMDYIVDEKYRGSFAGVQLCKKAIKENLHFGIGLSDVSLKMHLVFNEKIIGKMTKYIKVFNLLSLVCLLTKRFKTIRYTFPEHIKVGNTYFNKVNKPEEIKSDNGYWYGNDILEFSRNNEFLKWRFFYYPEKFIVYKMHDNTDNHKSVYFVVRNVVWRNLNCFLIVDYRFNSNSDFKLILKAIGKLSRLNNVSATITGASLGSLDKLLKKKLYFPYGNKMDIVTNFNVNSLINNVNNSLMVTFADSDCDHYFGNKKW